MKALVTGASGFVGSYLVDALLRAGESVAILCRPGSDLWRLDAALPRVNLIRGDLMDLPRVEAQIADFSPDTIFHLAWEGVGGRYRNDDAQIDKNFYSSIALLRLAQKLGCRTFVGLGSQAEYGPQGTVLDETARTEPTTAYGIAKLSTCLFGRHLMDSAGIRFVWMRLFSSYGPKDSTEWMIPYLIRTLLQGERPALTAGEQMWDYVYVADAAEAIYRAAITPDASGVFNLGSGRAHKLRDVVEQVRDMIDPGLSLGFGEVAYAPNQVMNLEADITRLCRVTGWEPKTTLTEGLYRTVKWFRSNS